MLDKKQLIALHDYCKLFRYQAEKIARESVDNQSFDTGLRNNIIHEQTRRAKELKRLETALGAEIDAFTEKRETVFSERTTSPRRPASASGAKHRSSATGKKSKGRGAGTTGTNNSGKNANDSNTKRKPGRPRKAAQITPEGE